MHIMILLHTLHLSARISILSWTDMFCILFCIFCIFFLHIFLHIFSFLCIFVCILYCILCIFYILISIFSAYFYIWFCLCLHIWHTLPIYWHILWHIYAYFPAYLLQIFLQIFLHNVLHILHFGELFCILCIVIFIVTYFNVLVYLMYILFQHEKRTTRQPKLCLLSVLDSITSSPIFYGFFFSLAWNRTLLSCMKLLRWRLEIGKSNWAAVIWPWHKLGTFLHVVRVLNVFFSPGHHYISE